MGRLITPSILSAAAFAKGAHGKWRESSIEGLNNQLSRIYKKDMPHYVTRGLEFEKTVYNCCMARPGTFSGSDLFMEVVERCRGAEYQKTAKLDIEVDGTTYTTYGKMDVYFEDLILDIKVTGKWQPPHKYLDTAQHLIYAAAMGVKEFEYLVIVMDDDDKIIEHYPIHWEWQSREAVIEDIRNAIREFREYLESQKLWGIYNDKFCLY